MAERERLTRERVPVLVAAGAPGRTGGVDTRHHLGHVVMTDPEGNEFCVA